MDDSLIIYIDRLRHSSEEKISDELPSLFMEIDEEDLSFKDPIFINGSAYLTDTHLVIHLDIATKANIPCKMCNDLKPFDVSLKGLYHTELLDDIKESFNLGPIIRDAILLEIPNYLDCNAKSCPNLETTKKFFKSQGDQQVNKSETVYHPFANLE